MRINISAIVCIAAFTVTAAAGCSPDDGPVQITSLKMNETEIRLGIGETFQLVATPRPADAKITLAWTSSDATVASVDENGLVTGIKTGAVTVTARYGSYSAKCAVNFMEEPPLDPSAALGSKLGNDIIYSKNVLLYANRRIMQGFDILPNGNIYYSQVGSSAYTMNICKADAANKNATDEYMILKRFGHGTQIVAEENGGKVYIWLNSNASVDAGGEYGNNWSFSRVEFTPGMLEADGYAGETFLLNKEDQYDQQVSIDFEKRRLLVGSRKSGIRHFWIFDLDEALALPLKEMSATVTIGGGGEPIPKETVERKMQARDLNDCRVLGNFSIPAGTDKENDVYSYSHQGHEVHGDYVYFYEGNAVETGTDKYRSKAYVTVFNYNGVIVVPRTEVAAISDVEGLNTLGLTTSGYAEAESMKIKNGKLYLGVACRDGSSSNRRANILVYDMQD